ncbi:MAG: metallophosphoesterase [Rhizobium sp.]|nr:metallophosphoesterase [Rhizobium sp.]
MFTLAHISDVHLGPLPDLTFLELLSKRITGYVNWRRNRGKQLFGNTLERLLEEIVTAQPSHLAITGDLVNLALNFEMDAAAQWLHAFHRPHDVSVVPGNHDAYVPGALDTAVKLWKPWMSGDTPRDDQHVFPYLRVRQNVALIGVSTATASPPFMASGYFGPNQARRFERLLKETGERGLFRVVMIHHPPIRGATPNYKRMIGIRRFHAAMHMDGAELVLHGHTHLNTTHWIQGHNGRVPAVGIAAGSQSFGGRKPPAAYNMFHIDGEKGRWSLRKERFSLEADGDTFSRDHEEVLLGP